MHGVWQNDGFVRQVFLVGLLYTPTRRPRGSLVRAVKDVIQRALKHRAKRTLASGRDAMELCRVTQQPRLPGKLRMHCPTRKRHVRVLCGSTERAGRVRRFELRRLAW